MTPAKMSMEDATEALLALPGVETVIIMTGDRASVGVSDEDAAARLPKEVGGWAIHGVHIFGPEPSAAEWRS